MKRIILDQALSLLCAGILMFGIPFACNGVILPIVIMEAIVLFNTVLLYPIALFLPLDLILGPRTEEVFFSRRALTFQCEFSESTSIWKESSREASVPYFPGVQEGRGPESCAAAAERYPVENYLLSVYENPEKL